MSQTSQRRDVFMFTSPSHAPDSIIDSRCGCFPRQLMPSLWPSNEPRKGFANTLSNLTELSARTYSRGASNGCSAES